MQSTQITPSKFLSEEEVSELFKYLDGTKERDAIIIELALRTGARASEILGLRKSDLFRSRELFIRGNKNSNDRILILPKKFFNKVWKYAEDIAPGELLFDIGYKRLSQIWDRYRPNKKKFHALRHTFAVNTYKNSLDLKLLKYLLGHKYLQNTMIYLDYTYSIEEQAKHLDNLYDYGPQRKT